MHRPKPRPRCAAGYDVANSFDRPDTIGDRSEKRELALTAARHLTSQGDAAERPREVPQGKDRHAGL